MSIPMDSIGLFAVNSCMILVLFLILTLFFENFAQFCTFTATSPAICGQ